MKDILATGLLFPEGPAILSNGTVLCSEQGASQVTIAEGEGGKVYAKTGGSPNAAIVGKDDIVYVTQNGGAVGEWRATENISPSIQRIDTDGSITEVCTSSNDGKLKAPNDLVFTQDGDLWFTDSGQAFDFNNMKEHSRLIRLSKEGKAETILDTGPVYNNGITEDNSGAIWWAETVPLAMCKLVDGKREKICVLPENHFPDGFVAAEDGRIFIATTYGHNITIINPDGKIDGFIELDDQAIPTNCIFDGSDLIISDFGTGWEKNEKSGRIWRVSTDAKGHSRTLGIIDKE